MNKRPRRAPAAPAGERLAPAAGVRLRIVDDEGVLFDARRRTAYCLNTAATLIWCRIESGDAGLRARDVDAATRAMIAQWHALGLLVAPGCAPPAALAVARQTRPRRGAPVPPPSPDAVWRHYRLLDSVVAMAFGEPGLAALVDPTLAHLACAAPTETPRLMAVDRHEGRFRLSTGGRLIDACASPSELAPLVKLHLARLAVTAFPHRFALHAGAVATPQGTLLLPAAAGSGKSVLTAAMMARGWSYLSDDTTLLAPRDFSVTGVAYALTIKEGAFGVVAPLFPELLRHEVHRRPDGQLVRYLAPIGREREGVPAAPPVRWIVSPRYAATRRPAVLKRLTRPAALKLLLANGGGARPLDWQTLNRIIDWLHGIESCALAYSSLDAAVAAIETLAAPR